MGWIGLMALRPSRTLSLGYPAPVDPLHRSARKHHGLAHDLLAIGSIAP
jgi:hypothetical protein